MFIGLALVLVALLWARKIRRDPHKAANGYRGPWIMGGVGVVLFAAYLWLVTHNALSA